MNLGKLEKKIMDYIWHSDTGQAFTVRETVSGFNTKSKFPYAYNTILTVVTHLYNKGMLSRKDAGKTYYYSVKINKDQYVKKTSRDLFNQMKRDYGKLAIAHFASLIDNIDPEILEEAKKELE